MVSIRLWKVGGILFSLLAIVGVIIALIFFISVFIILIPVMVVLMLIFYLFRRRKPKLKVKKHPTEQKIIDADYKIK